MQEEHTQEFGDWCLGIKTSAGLGERLQRGGMGGGQLEHEQSPVEDRKGWAGKQLWGSPTRGGSFGAV
jgi:hypothetical protein